MNILKASFLLTVASVMIQPAFAKTYKLTVASSHPTSVAWVGQMKAQMVDPINAQLKAQGSENQIEWTEAYAGVLYSFDDTLEAVSDGVADMGWVAGMFEPAKMPLMNVTYALPYVTPDPLDALEIMHKLSTRDGIFKDEWTKNNLVYLSTMATDGYQIYSKKPIKTPEDMKGLKILGSPSIGPWIEGYGATLISAGIPTMYNQLETGVGDAVMLITSGALPIKLHEVASHVTVLDMGPATGGGVAMNKDSWEALPEDVQSLLVEYGTAYNAALVKDVTARREAALTTMKEAGVELYIPEGEQRALWVEALPDIAGTWATAQEARGVPATQAIAEFMNEVNASGYQPLRDWAAK